MGLGQTAILSEKISHSKKRKWEAGGDGKSAKEPFWKTLPIEYLPSPDRLYPAIHTRGSISSHMTKKGMSDEVTVSPFPPQTLVPCGEYTKILPIHRSIEYTLAGGKIAFPKWQDANNNLDQRCRVRLPNWGEMLTVLMNKRNDKITLCSDGRVSFFFTCAKSYQIVQRNSWKEKK